MHLFLKESCCLALLIPTIFPVIAVSQASVATTSSSTAVQRVQPYSGTEWITITRQLAGGSSRTITQRIEVSRDMQGQWQRGYYRLTEGVQYDVSAPLDHTVSGVSNVAHSSLAPSLSNGEKLDLDEDLGTRFQNGLLTTGQRRTFLSVGRQPPAKHILETWYSPLLGVVVHSESHSFDGTVLITDLTNLQLGSAAGQ